MQRSENASQSCPRWSQFRALEGSRCQRSDRANLSLRCHLAGRGVPSITEGELRPSPAPSHCPQACPVLPPLLLLGPVLRGGGASPGPYCVPLTSLCWGPSVAPRRCDPGRPQQRPCPTPALPRSPSPSLYLGPSGATSSDRRPLILEACNF